MRDGGSNEIQLDESLAISILRGCQIIVSSYMDMLLPAWSKHWPKQNDATTTMPKAMALTGMPPCFCYDIDPLQRHLGNMDDADNNDEDDTPHLSQPHYSNATAMNILTVTMNGPH